MGSRARLLKLAPWTALGLVASLIVVSQIPGSLVLLFGLGVVGVILAWLVDPGLEVFGILIGLSVLPVLMVLPDVLCNARVPAENDLLVCLPEPVLWPYASVALALFLSGALLGLRRSAVAR